MKKTLSIILAAALVLVLAVTLFPATTAFAKEATELVLVDVRFSFANGLVLTFAANGKIGGYNLPSSVLINGKMVDVDCVVKNDEHTVVCHTTKDLGFKEGDSGYVTVFGQTMSFSAPKILKNEPKTENSAVSCPVYNWYSIVFESDTGIISGVSYFAVPIGDSLESNVAAHLASMNSMGEYVWHVYSVEFVGCELP